MEEKINLKEKFTKIAEYWSPRIIGELNGQAVKIAKLKGAFVWHHHEEEDELFLVISGRMVLQFRDGDVTLEVGEMIIVPRGVEHRPVAEEEALVMMFEPVGTLNTGNVRSALTLDDPERI